MSARRRIVEMSSPEVLPLVSVVVPTRNRASVLDVCLTSVLASGYPHDRYEDDAG